MRCPKRLERRRDSRGLASEPLERRQCLSATVSVTLAEPTVIEGETHVATIRLSQPLAQVERVMVSTADRTASFGRDYFRMMSEQIIFMPGETAKTVSIRTLRDSATEGVETFQITAAPVNPRLRPGSALARIGDYVPPPFVSIAGVSVLEGNSGTTPAVFTVTLSAAYAKEVSLSYATRDGSATVANNDYQATSGRLTFAAGETSKTITVNVVGDTRLEADETFTLVLSAATNATLRQTSATGVIRNDETDLPGYQITLVYGTPNLPAAQRAVFERAVARVQQIITGDVPGVTLAGGEFIDDMRINAFVETMPDNFNGFARATQWRPGTGGLPQEGEIRINSSRIGNPGIYHTIIHEILHAVGFYNTFFTDTGTISGLGTNQPLFTGANAVREYAAYYGIASPAGVPLFGDQTQPGSYASHWDTATLGTEIMSVGWDTTSTALRPFSRITIGALQDIGYQVNYGAADQYRRGGLPDTSPGTGRPPAAPRPPTTRTPTPSRTGRSASTSSASVRMAAAFADSALAVPQPVRRQPAAGEAAFPGLPRGAALAALANLATTEPALPRKATASRAFLSLAAR